MSQRLLFHVFSKVHQTTYPGHISVDAAELAINTSSWIWMALKRRSAQSEIAAVQRPSVRAPLRLLEELRDVDGWLELANRPTNSLAVEDVADAFRMIEQATLTISTWNPGTKATATAYARSLLLAHLKSEGLPRIEGIYAHFRCDIYPEVPSRRQLIGDLPGHLNDQPPIGAMPHTTVADLKAKTRSALEGVLDRISAACRMELDRLDRAREVFADFTAQPTDLALEHAVRTAQLTKETGNPTVAMRNASIASLARAYVAVAQSFHSERCKPLQMSRGDEVAEFIGTLLGMPRCRTPIVFFPLGTSMGPLLACLLILQRHTGWNVNVVLEMTTLGVSSRTPPFELQSYKTRIKKPSSIVIVEPSDRDVIRAINFLYERLDLMKRFGWVPAGETKLWLRDAASRYSSRETYSTWGHRLRKFQAEHGLPRFSLEQMRTQVLCLRGHIGGIEAMREAGHHQSITTTGGYAYQTLLHRENEAINLEFQRRLEKELTYNFGDSNATTLLWPIGDGSSCADPHHPPFEDYLSSGVCNAVACHADSGCPNRRIEVDEARIEEAFRTMTYYEKNWTRLLNANRDQFERFHLSSMVFNRGLLSVLQSGPYRHIVGAVRSRVEAELHHA